MISYDTKTLPVKIRRWAPKQTSYSCNNHCPRSGPSLNRHKKTLMATKKQQALLTNQKKYHLADVYFRSWMFLRETMVLLHISPNKVLIFTTVIINACFVLSRRVWWWDEWFIYAFPPALWTKIVLLCIINKQLLVHRNNKLAPDQKKKKRKEVCIAYKYWHWILLLDNI